MKLHIAGEALELADSERNRSVAEDIRNGVFPGLVQVDVAKVDVPVFVNLTSGSAFVLKDSSFRRMRVV